MFIVYSFNSCLSIDYSKIGRPPDIPLVLCTGYSEMMSEETARTLGVQAFLMKPILLGELAKTIRKALDDAAAKSSKPVVEAASGV